MLGSEVLDVAIGVIFVFLLVSIMASAIREGLEAWLKTRATHLELGIRELLHDPKGSGLVKQFFQHPLIYSLYSGEYTPKQPGLLPTALTGGGNLPSYIPSRNFALALMDMVSRGPQIDATNSHADARVLTFEGMRANVSLIQNAHVQRALLVALDNAQGDVQKVQTNLEAWYNSAMDRVSGWYKRSTHWMLFVIGFGIAVAMNVNTMVIADHLYREKATRDALVAQAQAAVANPSYDTQKYDAVRKDLQSLKLPMGGSPRQDLCNHPFPTLGGWLLTALAASFGAPFWFDLLNKLTMVRSTLKPQEKSPDQSAQDQQKQTSTPTAAPGTNPPVSPVAAAPTPPNLDDQTDGCDVEVTSTTKDEDLPASQGGVG